jgi:hypothetical protein
LREAHGGAKRAKHRAKRSPECADPAKQGHALMNQGLINFIVIVGVDKNSFDVDNLQNSCIFAPILFS